MISLKIYWFLQDHNPYSDQELSYALHYYARNQKEEMAFRHIQNNKQSITYMRIGRYKLGDHTKPVIKKSVNEFDTGKTASKSSFLVHNLIDKIQYCCKIRDSTLIISK